MQKILTASMLAGALALGFASQARAEEDEKPKNLKVLADNGKALEAGMKSISKGLGVKCNACHEKGKFDADTVPAKEEARKFFTAAIGEKDQAKRDGALKALANAMKLKEAKDAAELWKGVDQLKKK